MAKEAPVRVSLVHVHAGSTSVGEHSSCVLSRRQCLRLVIPPWSRDWHAKIRRENWGGASCGTSDDGAAAEQVTREM
jgi:hypothetical protein